MKSVDDLVKIASYGGGLDLRNHRLTTDALVKIASYAKGKGSHIIIDGTSKTTDDMVKIASYGGGCALFVFN
ncbi:hypothetical protein ACFQI3_02100 [Hansschlegelia quercus]|uniref:hypothetical protein n=1 Tax=Hansschlegelia quercus TaxID=2528245 RepID=UPI001034DD41|nr:hypothetical protein [Hansschlegelia quercus]